MSDDKELVVNVTNETEKDKTNSSPLTLTVTSVPNPEKDWLLYNAPGPCEYFDNLRWKINLWGLYHPCTCCKKIKPLRRITVSDIVIFIVFLIVIVFILIADINESTDIDQDVEQLKNEKLFGISTSFGRASVRCYIAALLFSQRNTMMRYIFGFPFERAILYHQHIAKIGLIMSWVHFITMLVYWSNKNGTSINEGLAVRRHAFGLVAWCCVELGAILAHEKVRPKIFEIFMKSHWILMTLFVTFAVLHTSQGLTLPLFCVAIGLHIIDVMIRLVTSFSKPARIINIEYIEDNNAVKIEFVKAGFSFIGGQYIFLNIPTISLTQWHPFSLSSGSRDGVLTLHIKCVGDFVEKLKHLVIEMEKTPNFKHDSLKIYVEGPYGSPSIPKNMYSSLILMSGGIGINPMESIFSDLMNSIKENKNDINKLNRIHFVWSVKKCEMIKEFNDIHVNVIKKYTNKSNKDNKDFDEMIKINNIEIKTSYFVTRVDDEEEQEKWKQIYSNLYFKRPSAKNIIEEAQQSVGGQCVGIMGCGPQTMMDDINNEAAVHSIHCHVEAFAF